MNKNFSIFGATALSRPISVEDLDRRYAVWPVHYVPDNRGRNAEKRALALVKSEAKRRRKAVKRATLAEPAEIHAATKKLDGPATGG